MQRREEADIVKLCCARHIPQTERPRRRAIRSPQVVAAAYLTVIDEVSNPIGGKIEFVRTVVTRLGILNEHGALFRAIARPPFAAMRSVNCAKQQLSVDHSAIGPLVLREPLVRLRRIPSRIDVLDQPGSVPRAVTASQLMSKRKVIRKEVDDIVEYAQKNWVRTVVFGRNILDESDTVMGSTRCIG